ncbi:flagellar basal body-associated FliL family protein [Helicobacter didelphidarum]|nr:flagellar basal body-associated FliL family protein [Helicobacter didelphidarum]
MSIIFLLAHVLHAKSIEYVFKNEFGTKLKPSTESFDKDSEIIGGYAKYRISVAVGTQNEMDLINDKKEEENSDGGGSNAPSVQVANLSPEQQALLQNEAYKNPAAIQPIEKDFVINLKSPNPDNMREGGFVKFKATLLLGDKNTVKEIDAKVDVVRSVITDATSAFTGVELQSAQGRQKLANSIVSSLNSVLTDGKVAAIVFPDFVLQP